MEERSCPEDDYFSETAAMLCYCTRPATALQFQSEFHKLGPFFLDFKFYKQATISRQASDVHERFTDQQDQAVSFLLLQQMTKRMMRMMYQNQAEVEGEEEDLGVVGLHQGAVLLAEAGVVHLKLRNLLMIQIQKICKILTFKRILKVLRLKKPK